MYIERKLVLYGGMVSVLFSLSFFSLPAVSLAEQSQQRFKTYNDSEGRYEIGYPETWYVNEYPSKTNKDITVQFDYGKPKLAASGEDITMPSIRIIVRDALPDEITLDRLSNKLVNNASLNPIVAIEESGYANLAGYTAYAMKCIIQNNVSNMMWTLRNDNVFLIEYKANSLDYETHLPAFQVMVNTFTSLS